MLKKYILIIFEPYDEIVYTDLLDRDEIILNTAGLDSWQYAIIEGKIKKDFDDLFHPELE